MSRRRYASAAALATLATFTTWTAAAGAVSSTYIVDESQSVFAVLTHKAGIASGLAHDHVVVAPQPEVKLEFDPQAPESTKFSFSVKVDSLEIDAPGPRAAWKGRFKALGIHSGELPVVSDSDRGKVRVAMLGDSQLDREKFPEIRAEVVKLEAPSAGAAANSGAWNVGLRVTIHGKTVERQLPASWSEKDGVLRAEIYGELHFEEFGIEPYSAMLGAIRNNDMFHIYVNVVARRAP
ncbi:MAG: YceI family protein [Thermoanaerobaculia bacterium]